MMARFSLIKSMDTRCDSYWLSDETSDRAEIRIDRADADEIRKLLNEAFPPTNSLPIDTELVGTPAQGEPDQDGVRRALNEPWPTQAVIQTMRAAARAWLRLREQPATPSIADVIEACGDSWDGMCVVPNRVSSGWRAFVYKTGGASQFSAVADTPEAAIRALYDDAVAKLKAQRDEAQVKLAKLGVG